MTLSNPITMKELRSRMRGLRAILPMMAYLAVLSVFVLITFADYGMTMQYSTLAQTGRTLGFALLYAQIFLVLILAPAYAASAIAIEKERETFGVMQITLLTSWDIVAGKVFSGFSYAALLAVSSLPLLSLSFWMGGFDFVNLFWGFLIIALCAFVTSCAGILVSTIFTRSYLATGATYGVVLASTGLGYLSTLVPGLWHQSQMAGANTFSWDTIPVWLGYTLNPFHMLQVLDRGSAAYYSGAGFYANPLIDFFDQWLRHMHLPYVALHVVMSIGLGALLLGFASGLLFRRSREDNP
jgi:ABC-type transport system involved in multi-copper enzyme maturation permease subunit